MPSLKKIVFPQGGPLGPTITSLSPLPQGTVGQAYSFALQAIGNNPPFIWTLVSGALPSGISLASNGVLSGTPTLNVTSVFTVQATDALGLTAPKSFSFTVNPSSGANAGPTQLWPGFVDSSHALIAAWPTAVGGENTYNFYRSTDGGATFTKVNANPIVPSTTIGGGSVAQPFVIDSGTTAVGGKLAPSTTYTYGAKAIIGGVETQLSPTITMTTLAGPIGSGTATPPTAATAPETWIVPPPAQGSLQSVPPGNNLFIVTPTGGSPASTPNPGGGLTYNGCTLAFALPKVNLNGGDVVAIQPGTYSVSNLTCPTVTGSGGFTYFVSTQALEYSLTGTLPPYSTRPNPDGTPFQITAPLTVAATFIGNIVSGTLNVISVTSGAIAAGQSITGFNIPYGLTIASGGGNIWTLSGTANVGGTFTGSISGTTLTAVAGLAPRSTITGFGVAAGTTIVAITGTANVYTVSPSQNVASETMTASRNLSTGGATSATLSTPFQGRTGYYPTRFTPLSGSLTETRAVLFRNGSTALVWNVPLTQATTNIISADIGNYVTPWDSNAAGLPVANPSPSMPILQFSFGSAGEGFLMNVGTGKVRTIGVHFQPTVGFTVINYGVFHNATSVPLESIYMDRCIVGADTSLWPGGMGYITHGVGSNANHALYHQCYFYGLVDGSGGNGLPGGQDSNCVAIAGGGPVCVQNCYEEAQNEGVITGGQPVAQASIPRDLVRRWNTAHKPTQWQLNAIGTEVKNLHELKVGIRVVDQGNLIWNNWYDAASQGQWGRGLVNGARDQTAGWSPGNSAFNPTVVTGVSGNVVTFTCAGATSNPFFFRGLNNGHAWLSGASGITNSMFKITAAGGGAGPNFTLTSNTSFVGTYTSGGTVAPADDACQGPWNVITDVDVFNNRVYDCAAMIYVFTGDSSATAFTGRVRIRNNIFFGNPGTDRLTTLVNPFAIQLFGCGPDITIDHNTVILNEANPNYQHAAGNAFFSAGVAYLATAYNLPFVDRVQITNNLLGGNFALLSLPNNNSGGLTAFNGAFSNSTYSNNAQIIDAATFAGSPTNGNTVGTNLAAVGFGNLGMANFTGTTAPTTAPLYPSDWNVVSGTLATASSTGGPVGAIFPQLQFPLLGAYLEGGGLLDPGTLTHIGAMSAIILTSNESDTTLTTRVQNAKNANPNMVVTCYVKINSQLPNFSGTPTENTQIASANWYARASWPSGAICTEFSGAENANNIIQSRTSNGAPFPGAPTLNRTIRQWFAAYANHFFGPGKAANLDGVFTDNVYYQPRAATGGTNQADWNETGTAVSDSSVQAQWRAAYTDYDTQLRQAMGPTYFQHWANCADWGSASGVVYPGVFNGGVIESQEQDEAFGWSTMMGFYKAAMLSMVPGGDGRGPFPIFEWQAPGTTGNALIYARYGFGSCLLDNGYFYWNTANNAAIAMLDEMGLNLGYPIAGPNNPVNGTYSDGRLTVWQSGVWRRDFSNAIVLVNPRGNGAKAITFASTDNGGTYWHFTGTQDSTLNNGAAVTTITMPDSGSVGTGGSAVILFRTSGH